MAGGLGPDVSSLVVIKNPHPNPFTDTPPTIHTQTYRGITSHSLTFTHTPTHKPAHMDTHTHTHDVHDMRRK